MTHTSGKDSIIVFMIVGMIVLIAGLGVYGHFGEHKIYNETITVKWTGLEDGSPHIMTYGDEWISCDIMGWNTFLNVDNGDVMDVQIIENVYGGKIINRVWRKIE